MAVHFQHTIQEFAWKEWGQL